MPSWWNAKEVANNYTDRIIEQNLKFVVVWVTVGENDLPDMESE